jgi:hypothetical protein
VRKERKAVMKRETQKSLTNAYKERQSETEREREGMRGYDIQNNERYEMQWIGGVPGGG